MQIDVFVIDNELLFADDQTWFWVGLTIFHLPARLQISESNDNILLQNLQIRDLPNWFFVQFLRTFNFDFVLIIT